MNLKSPKYIQISEEIISRITSGELQPGDKIPSENELIKTYKISNTTARKSLQEIELKGWGTRIKGRGTFVLNTTEDKHLTRTLGSIFTTRSGFDANLIKEGFVPKNIILEKSILDTGISIEINGHFYIIEGPVVKIHRLRYANDVLMKDETRYISLKICPKINMLETSKAYFSIYEEKYKLKIVDMKQTLSAVIFTQKTVDNYFESPVPLPVFLLDSAIFISTGKVVEIEKSYYRGDKYKFLIIAKPEIFNP
ncbi:MAG: GntR family transcriptional regulator [Draconibacterium sp.]|nr:GntR family transcriptional regulator [Draconibacterium sp.]